MAGSEKISRGMTFSGTVSWVGLMVLIAGSIVLILKGLVVAFPVILVGGILFLSIRGVEIDYQNKKIRSYFHFGLFIVGRWDDISAYEKIVLSLYREAQTMNYKWLSKEIQTRSYDVILVGGELNLVLKEFESLKKARKFLKVYGEKLDVPKADYIMLAQSSGRAMRSAQK